MRRARLIIETLEAAVNLIEKASACGAGAPGKPGFAPGNTCQGGGGSQAGGTADKFKDWSPEASLDAVRATLRSALKGKRLKEIPNKMSSWGVSFSTKSLSATAIEIAFRKDGWSTNTPPNDGSSNTTYFMVKGSNLALISSLSYSGPSHIMGTDPEAMALVMNRSPHG